MSTAAVALAPPQAVPLRVWIAVASGLLGAFMAILDIQITNSSLRDILGTLSATPEEGSWISTSYLVAEIVVIPLTGLLCRIFSMRLFMLGTTLLFLIFSTLCGNAWSLESMIVFRMMQGLTGGAMIPLSMTLVMLKLPLHKRAVGMALFGLMVTLAPALGPTVGGYLSEMYGWPSIFYINWIPGILLLAGIAYGLEIAPTNLALLGTMDWLGIGFMALGLGSLTIFLEEGNLKDWFDSNFIITFAGLAVVGLLGWVTTSLYEKSPFVNLKLYTQRNFFVSAILSAVFGVALYGSVFLMPLFLGQVIDYTPLQIGQVTAWFGLPQLLIMPFVARLSAKVDNRILCSFGLLLYGISCFMNANLDATTGYDDLVWTHVVRALGHPFIMLTLSNFAIRDVPAHDMPSASSLYNMTRHLGGSVGIALLATLLTNREHFHSARLGESVSLFSSTTQARLDILTQNFIAHGVEPSTAANQAIAALNNVVRRESYVLAYNDCFWIIGIVLIACIGVVWFADRTTAAPPPSAPPNALPPVKG